VEVITRCDEIVADLATANFDVYLDNREIRYHPLDLGQRLGFGQSPDGDLAVTPAFATGAHPFRTFGGHVVSPHRNPPFRSEKPAVFRRAHSGS
jgi:hypothetical protein